MKRILSLAVVMAFIIMLFAGCAGEKANVPDEKDAPAKSEGENVSEGEWKPEGPIKILNYVKSGGGMDVATRKFTQIASKYTDAIFVVDNMPGSGGLIAMDYVLTQPADGYTIFAGTISNIPAVISNEEDIDHYIRGFQWIDNIMQDPMTILVRKAEDMTLEDLIADSVDKKGEQIWVGPSTGGIKHIIGLKFWDALGIEATWVPCESGPEAMKALLGGQGIASVGNPSDVEGRELKNLVIATKEKLPNFPDVPNFADCGFPELDNVSMWRGFAVKKGTPEPMIKWFQDLCQKVTEDQEWIDFFASRSIKVKNDTTEVFTKQVEADIEDNLTYLKKFGFISEDYNG